MAELADKDQSADQFLDAARQQMLSGDLDSAQNTVRAVLTMTPTKARAWYLMGEILSTLPGNRAEASEAYKRALVLDPTLYNAQDGIEALSERDTMAPQRPKGRLDDLYALQGPAAGEAGRPAGNGAKEDAISRARMAEQSYNWAVARAAWEEVLGLDDTDTWAWAQYAHLLSVHLQQFDGAEAAYKRGLRADPTDDWLWAKLGIMLADFRGRVEDGQEHLKRAIQLDDTECYYHGWIGWSLYRQSEKYGEAELHLERAVKLWPGYQWAWFHLGLVRMEMGDRPGLAEVAFKKALAIDPKDPVSLFSLGSLYAEQLGKPRLAYRAWRKALNQVPDDIMILKKLANLCFEVLDDQSRAKTLFEYILSIEDQDIESLVRLGSLLWEQRGEVEEGLKLIQKGVDLAPGNAWAWAHLGLIHWRGGRNPQEARSCFSQAILCDPDFAWAHTCMGDLLYEQEANKADIISSYLAATDIVPEDPWNWIQLGRTYEINPADNRSALLAYEKYYECTDDQVSAVVFPLSIALMALKDMERAAWWASNIEIETCDDPLLLIMAGRTWRLAHFDLDRAEAMFRRAIAIEPDDHFAWHELGELMLYDRGDLVQAAECLRTSQKYDSSCSSLLADLSIVMWAEGNHKEAMQTAEQACKEHGDEAQAWTSLASLRYLAGAPVSECLALAEKAVALDGMLKNARLAHLALLELEAPESKQIHQARQAAVDLIPNWLDVEEEAFRYIDPLSVKTFPNRN